MPSQTRIQSVGRAIQILTAIAATDTGYTVKAIADKFELSTPTAYHLLNTLVGEGALLKDAGRRFVLGPATAVFAEAYNRRNVVPERYLVALRQLATATSETAYLSEWRDGKVVVLSTVEGTEAVRVAGLSNGYADNVHARASGKLLLAYASKDLRESVLGDSQLKKVTGNTITSRSKLSNELEAILVEGIAYDREEFREGVTCASAPISRGGAVVACFTVASPTDRFEERHDHIVRELKRLAADASLD